MRNQIANMLGYTMVTKKFFGNPHAEAINIIEHKTKGWQDRCTEISKTIYNRISTKKMMKTYSWYQMLHLCATSAFQTVAQKKLGFKKSIEMCSNSKQGILIRQLENEVLRNIARDYLIKGNAEQTALIQAWWDSRHQYQQVLDNLHKGGIKDEDTLKYAFTVYMASLEVNEKKQLLCYRHKEGNHDFFVLQGYIIDHIGKAGACDRSSLDCL